jgi:hypothetical protein
VRFPRPHREKEGSSYWFLLEIVGIRIKKCASRQTPPDTCLINVELYCKTVLLPPSITKREREGEVEAGELGLAVGRLFITLKESRNYNRNKFGRTRIGGK